MDFAPRSKALNAFINQEGNPFLVCVTGTYFKVYTDIYDAPVIINTCVIKRHHTANFTCAIKNNVGTVAGPDAVFTRRYLHFDSEDFMNTVKMRLHLCLPEAGLR